MKRYDLDVGYASSNMVPDPNGEYVLAFEAQAEIERLRGLVKECAPAIRPDKCCGCSDCVRLRSLLLRIKDAAGLDSK